MNVYSMHVTKNIKLSPLEILFAACYHLLLPSGLFALLVEQDLALLCGKDLALLAMQNLAVHDRQDFHCLLCKTWLCSVVETSLCLLNKTWHCFV